MLVCVIPEPHSFFFFFCKTVKTGSNSKQNFRVLKGSKAAGYSKEINVESLKKVCDRYCEDSKEPRTLSIKPRQGLLSINGKAFKDDVVTTALSLRSWSGVEDIPIIIVLHEQEKVVVMHNLFTNGVVCLLGFKEPKRVIEYLLNDEDMQEMITPR